MPCTTDTTVRPIFLESAGLSFLVVGAGKQPGDFNRSFHSLSLGTIDPASSLSDTARMGRYQSLVGKRVEAHYRAGDLHLTAAGLLAGDSGKSIFIEERFSQHGKSKTLRLEIPYRYIIRLDEAAGAAPQPAARASCFRL